MRKFKLVLLVLLLALPMAQAREAGVSADGGLSPEARLDLGRSFEAQRQAILKALADGKTYSEISPQDRAGVQASLDRISGLLDGVQSVEQLHDEEKVRVFNEQEKINTMLTKAHRDSRVICVREKPTGSNRPVRRCATVAERERATNASQDMFRDRPSRRLPGE